MAPVRGHEVQNPAGDEGKSDGVRSGHPLAMLDDLAVARSEEGGGGADHPSSSLHGGSRQTGTTPRKSDPRERADKDGNHVDATQNAMELEIPVADPRGEIDGPNQEREDSSQRMGDEEAAVGDDLEAVGVVHRVIGGEKDL